MKESGWPKFVVWMTAKFLESQNERADLIVIYRK
jgi:hypothetical protein